MKVSGAVVSVLIPTRNEARHIEACVAAIAAQDFPLDQLEVVVVDGCSQDGTAERAERALASVGFLRAEVLRNPIGSTPSSLNVGLAAANGEYLCRVDARSFIPPDYIGRCVALLQDSADVAVVGGAQVAMAEPGAGDVQRGIARALRNPYATGMARYRRRVSSGPTDTVYLGVFRTSDLRAAGGWDERLLTNQDYELNRRMRRCGLVWFEAGIEVPYRPRASLGALAAQYRRFGRWKGRGWVELGVPLSPRHVALVLAPLGCIAAGTAGLWRRRLATLTACAGGVALLDRAAGAEPSARVRAWSVVATAVIGASWWLGVIEQLLRSLIDRSAPPPGNSGDRGLPR